MSHRLRIAAIWLLLLALAGFFCPCHPQAANQPQAKPRRFLMWKAVSPTATLYLVGSIHVGDKGMYPLPQEVESAFTAAKVLAVEINVKSVDRMKTMELIQKNGMYSGDDSLSKHISKETSDALNDFCSKHNLP